MRGADIMHILYALLRRTHEMRRAWAVLELGGIYRRRRRGGGTAPGMDGEEARPAAREADGRAAGARSRPASPTSTTRSGGGGKVDTDTALTLTLAAAA